MICFEHAFSGLTLDLGGGAEGVILHLYPAGSIAVDKKLEEILEVPAPLKAAVMDASSLGFASGSFTQATAFYAWKQVSAGFLLVSDQSEGDKIHQVWQK